MTMKMDKKVIRRKKIISIMMSWKKSLWLESSLMRISYLESMETNFVSVLDQYWKTVWLFLVVVMISYNFISLSFLKKLKRFKSNKKNSKKDQKWNKMFTMRKLYKRKNQFLLSHLKFYLIIKLSILLTYHLISRMSSHLQKKSLCVQM